ncbi:sugar isomerase domain-containing protein [Sporosalibacterium faouarense]|uniref:sugar isomerase domain-containing protein n=1 Tax=Sporosalibacterium faouarense TaxID=516123 RepID=UPI00141CEBFF|nr:SIS domain-containing protein [Sporosalibacterium faouarense]MTI47121.1 SIS domain-containing protein [Bacillota bacterium]
MKINAEVFFKEAYKILDELKETQMEKIKEASYILTESISRDGVIHIFGSGHSKAFAMELVYRAGGLVPMHRVTLDDLALKGDLSAEDLLDPQIERDPENAHKLWNLYEIHPQDAFIIVSNSGRNGTIVEFASMVKEKNMPLIVVTSIAHSKDTVSRHNSGKKLYELGDVVIDNCGPKGDALIPVEGLRMKACSISSITGAFIAQGLTAETINNFKEKGVTPPVFISANVDGGDQHNDALRAKYEGRI